jgi:cytochrome c oxidase subunit 2
VEEPGVYRGQCTELCGKDHGFMPVVVEVKSEADYAQWVADQKAMKLAMAGESAKEFSMDELIAKGEGVYNKVCAACHQPGGQGIPGAFPAITGSPVATGAIEKHIDIIVNGKAGTAMQAFGQQLSAVDIASVVTFQRNRLGNSVGDSVQPSAIEK